MEEAKSNNTPSTQWTQDVPKGNPIWEKPIYKVKPMLYFFFSAIKWKYKERGSHYGVDMDIVANMLTTWSSISFVLLQYPTSICPSQLWNNSNIIRMESLPILVALYLTCLTSCLGSGLGFLHASTPN